MIPSHRIWKHFLCIAIFCLATASAADLPVYTYNPVSPDLSCASKPACSTWLTFRQAHPWPYQVHAIAESGTEAVLIFSEPPPSLPKAQLTASVTALFGDDLLGLEYYRWPTGLDGWLEDLVARVRVRSRSRAAVISGDTLSRVNAPAEIVDRLRILYRLQYQTADGFFLVNARASAPPSGIQELQIPGDEIAGWLNRKETWTPLGKEGTVKTVAQALAEKTPSTFVSDEGLVALVAPRGSKLADLEAPFRVFAVSSDLLVGATATPNGGLVLLARERQLPMAQLPPLRFETFSTFARNKAAELAQSYERQRIFAGRILDGQYSGWDWAPILLSSHLDDTEYGTLLNLADQILKSWSQHGEVEYFAFAYPKPETYPFEDVPASEYFASQFLTTSLLFNWNTERFSNVEKYTTGEFLTPDRTGALTILYRPSGGLLEDFLEEEGQDAQEFKKLYEVMQDFSDEAAEDAREYFAARGDPILVRVVQNTMLYQAVEKFLSLADTRAAPRTARSARVVEILQAQAAAWLKSVTQTPADPEVAPEVREAVSEFLKKSRLTVAELAVYIASPQSVLQDLLRDDRAYRAKSGQMTNLLFEALPLEIEASGEFSRACAAVKGAIAETEKGKRCNWTAAQASRSFAFAEYDRLEAQLKGLEARVKTLDAETDTLAKAIAAKEKTYLEAHRLGELLSAHATDTNLDAVLAAVLKGVAAPETSGSIRTPSVVLSKNTENLFAVGGHNISRATQPASIAPVAGSPKRATTAIRPPEPPPSTRPAREALAASSRKGSLLNEMRPAAEAAEAQPQRMARAAERAKTCDCDTLVVQESDGSIFFVRNQPPATQKAVFGKSGLLDALAGPPKAEVVRFEGFTSETVEGIARSTNLSSGRPRPAGIDGALRDLAAVFKEDTPVDGAVSIVVEKRGASPQLLRVFGEQDALASLKQRITWASGRVESNLTRWTQDFGVANALDAAKHDGIIVRFGSVTPSSLGIRVAVPAAQRPGVIGRLSTVVRGWLTTRPPTPWAQGLIDLRTTIRRQLSPTELDFFYSGNAGKIRVAETIDLRDYLKAE